MITRIGRCGIGYPGATHGEVFIFEDETSEKEMQDELWEWAKQFLEAWFEDGDSE